jgi:hypothetical protein
MHLGATSVAFFATSTIKFLILEKLPTKSIEKVGVLWVVVKK